MEECRDGLANGGVALHSEALLSRAASSRRREKVVPAALEEEDERLKMDVGRWM